MAEHLADDDMEGFRDQMSLGIRAIAVVIVPATAGLVILARRSGAQAGRMFLLWWKTLSGSYLALTSVSRW